MLGTLLGSVDLPGNYLVKQCLATWTLPKLFLQLSSTSGGKNMWAIGYLKAGWWNCCFMLSWRKACIKLGCSKPQLEIIRTDAVWTGCTPAQESEDRHFALLQFGMNEEFQTIPTDSKLFHKSLVFICFWDPQNRCLSSNTAEGYDHRPFLFCLDASARRDVPGR